MLGQLQQNTAQAVSAMETGKDHSRQGLAKAEQAAGALDTVMQSVTTINALNIQIACATEQQSAVCEEMNKNMIKIQSQSNTVSEQAALTRKMGESLTLVADKQHHLVKRFKV